MNFSRIAFIGQPRSAEYLKNWIGDVTDVFLVNPASEITADLQQGGFTVHALQSEDEIPEDVFRFFRRPGFWATVHKESGYIRNVSFAENSHQATLVLLSNYAKDYRAEFTVKPVDVTIADCSSIK